jgi:hypothetical protein
MSLQMKTSDSDGHVLASLSILKKNNIRYLIKHLLANSEQGKEIY